MFFKILDLKEILMMFLIL